MLVKLIFLGLAFSYTNIPVDGFIVSIFNIFNTNVSWDGMDNSQILFTENLNVFRNFKDFTTILEGSNILKLYSVEVCFYQTCKFVVLGENINDRFKTIVFGFLNDIFVVPLG